MYWYTNPMLRSVMARYWPQDSAPFYTSRHKKGKANKDDLLEDIKEAILDERLDELLYNSFICLAANQAEVEMLAQIRDDEHKHVDQFRQLYKDLTGKVMDPPPCPTIQTPPNYVAALEKGIKAELEAIVAYNEILAMLDKERHKFLLIEIINDELKHLGQFNYLYTKHLHKHK